MTAADLHPDTREVRPSSCCGACPPIAGGGWDCTCPGLPGCPANEPGLAAGRAETTTADCPECGDNYCRCGIDWTADPRAETTTATDEDALDSLPYFTFEDNDVAPDEEFVRKADVARLLATARTRPTREQIIDALVMSPLSDTAGTDMRPFEQTADAVLALYADQPETTTEWGVRFYGRGPFDVACELLAKSADYVLVRREVGPWTEDVQ